MAAVPIAAAVEIAVRESCAWISGCDPRAHKNGEPAFSDVPMAVTVGKTQLADGF